MNFVNALNALSGHVYAFMVFLWLTLIFAFKYRSGSGAIGFFVDTLNAVHDNILAVVVISIGAIVSRYDRATGTTLITIGATVWNNKPKALSASNGNGNGNGNGSSLPLPASSSGSVTIPNVPSAPNS